MSNTPTTAKPDPLLQQMETQAEIIAQIIRLLSQKKPYTPTEAERAQPLPDIAKKLEEFKKSVLDHLTSHADKFKQAAARMDPNLQRMQAHYLRDWVATAETFSWLNYLTCLPKLPQAPERPSTDPTEIPELSDALQQFMDFTTERIDTCINRLNTEYTRDLKRASDPVAFTYDFLAIKNFHDVYPLTSMAVLSRFSFNTVFARYLRS